MRVALIHDWLVNRRGAEHILESICEVFPQADIFTLIYVPEDTFESFRYKHIKTSVIQNLPFAKERFRSYLPLFPKAIERFELKGYELIISISHCVAKGVRGNGDSVHISYCLTPMRYIWLCQDEYFGIFKGILSPLLNYLKRWDVNAANRVDHLLTISNHIRERIKRCYGMDSSVIFPPVDIGYFLNEPQNVREDFYLVVSELVPYKRVELAVDAFNELGLRLLVVGDGPCKKRMVKRAKKNITFLDWQPRDELKRYYCRAKALVYPQEEDFGLVAVEAQATGCPVIAYAKGGALDTVVESKTGIFFGDETKESLIKAVRRFNDMSFEHREIVENAKRFDKEIFKRKFKEFIDAALEIPSRDGYFAGTRNFPQRGKLRSTKTACSFWP